ncbi:hypothetical protein EDD86DRAFT_194243 [Gorgonomyces haynaldii]|nr:hypothetical protein EDD86DRAFT_194243 [Gorgonomyces haynaldii]
MDSLPFSGSDELPNDIPAPDNPIPYTLVNSQPLDQRFLAPYVPMNPTVVEEAIRFANVDENDVLCDLGCGDGRVLVKGLEMIANLKCVGIELDPYLIEHMEKEHKQWIESQQLQIVSEDFMKLDLEKYGPTVMVLYLLPEALMKLRTKLQEWIHFKPNRRIVVVTFSIDGWHCIRGKQVVPTTKQFGAGSHGVGHWLFYYDASSIQPSQI